MPPSPPIPASHSAVRLTLIVSSLRSGGAERVMAVLADHWARSGRDVTLLTFMPPDETPFFPLDPRVRLVRLDLDRPSRTVVDGIGANLWRARALRRAVRDSRPDVVLSFMDRTNVLTLAATLGLGIPIVVQEHNDPAEERLSRSWTILRDLTYRRAASVVALSTTALSYFAAPIRRRGRVIPNPVVRPLGATTTREPASGGTRIVGMGRLVPQKGFDLLLDAMARLEARARGWTVDVWGEGPMRPALEAARDRLGLADVVRFPGVTPTPGAVMAAADLFVLSSRYEGFPTVLGEAMAAGTPVVAFDCPSGPREMIRDGVDGLLVPDGDIAALAAAIERVLTDDALRTALAAHASEILERFSIERIAALWDELFSACLTRKVA
jgi:GalNAc-alpha-(1->4)-GalNAc-alpha-(1->3)-diNAcBac-PP-undecaprenol alpha-1,4-N-acetyl-D-galactosaminyltransferase